MAEHSSIIILHVLQISDSEDRETENRTDPKYKPRKYTPGLGRILFRVT